MERSVVRAGLWYRTKGNFRSYLNESVGTLAGTDPQSSVVEDSSDYSRDYSRDFSSQIGPGTTTLFMTQGGHPLHLCNRALHFIFPGSLLLPQSALVAPLAHQPAPCVRRRCRHYQTHRHRRLPAVAVGRRAHASPAHSLRHAHSKWSLPVNLHEPSQHSFWQVCAPAKFIAPAGATQIARGKAPCHSARTPSFRTMDTSSAPEIYGRNGVLVSIGRCRYRYLYQPRCDSCL